MPPAAWSGYPARCAPSPSRRCWENSVTMGATTPPSSAATMMLDAAGGLERLSSSLRSKPIEEVLGELRDYGRNNPTEQRCNDDAGCRRRPGAAIQLVALQAHRG